jgi:predicted transcriptional regulator
MDYETPASAQQILAFMKTISHNNEATVSFNTICRETGLSKTTVVNGIMLLRASGIIKRERATNETGGYATNTYTIKGEQS